MSDRHGRRDRSHSQAFEADRCGVTRKVRFKSFGHAKFRAQEILQNESRSIENQASGFRIYGPCAYCSGYHLTTQAKRAGDLKHAS